MGLIKEPLDVDFVVDPRPLTMAEKKAITDFIRADKEKRKRKELKNNIVPRRKKNNKHRKARTAKHLSE